MVGAIIVVKTDSSQHKCDLIVFVKVVVCSTAIIINYKTVNIYVFVYVTSSIVLLYYQTYSHDNVLQTTFLTVSFLIYKNWEFFCRPNSYQSGDITQTFIPLQLSCKNKIRSIVSLQIEL